MIYATYLFAFFTLFVLVTGLAFMGVGGKLNRKFSTKLMALRVVFQGLALVALAILYYMSK